MRRGIYFFIIVVFLSSIGLAQAEDKLSLKEALKIAYEGNPAVVSARKDIKIAQAQYRNAKKWDNPELEVEVGNLAKDLEGDSSFSARNVDSEIRITQPIEGWGKKRLRKKIATNALKQQETEFKNVWIGIVRKIKEKYTQVLIQRKAVDLAQENLVLNQRFLDQIKIKFDSGDSANHELSRAKLEVINARNKLLSAQKAYVIKKGELNLLLGQSIHKNYALIDNFQIDKLDDSYDELLKKALKKRGDIVVQEMQVDTKAKELKLSKRERLPGYDLSFFIEREEEIYKGGVGIAFELPIWNLQSNEIKQARLEKEKAESSLQQLQNEVALEVYTVFHEVDLAKKSHDISIEAIKEANEILRFTTLGYDEGEVSFLSYLENINTYQETKQAYFESLAEYTIKIAELEQVIGKEYTNE